MANDKEIRIRAVLDASGFDNQVNKLQQKLKQMQQTQEGLGKASNNFGTDKMMGSYAKQAFGDFSKDSKKQLEDMYQSQRREAMNQKINLKSKEQELKQISSIEGQMTKDKKEQVSLLEKEIQLLKQKQQLTIQQASKTKEILGQMTDDNEAGQGQQPTGGGGIMGGFKGMLKAIGIGALVKGALNAVVTGAEHVITRDRQILTNRGASANMASREMREQFQGQGSKGIFYAGQRQKAMKMAEEEQRRQGGLDIMKVGGAVLGAGAAGAAAGSFIPGLGTAVGGVIGAVGGFAGAMSSDKLRSRVFDQDQYQSMMTKEGMQKYESNLAAQKALDPRRTMAQEYFQQNAGRMQQLQRSGGMLTDEALLGKTAGPDPMLEQLNQISNVPQLKDRKEWQRMGRGAGWATVGQGYDPTGTSPLQGGLQADTTFQDLISGEKDRSAVMEGGIPMGRRSEGYLIDQIKGGTGTAQYSEENIMRQRQAILAGGGSTQSQDLASTAAQFERNAGMMNAGSVFGKVAGAGMGVDETQSEDAVKRLLAEGVKMGVNTSTMPQELKRFTEAAADILTQGGGLSDTAVSRFAGGLGGTSAVDIAAGKGAYDEAKGLAKGAGGMEGQIGYGYLMGDKAKDILGKEGFSKLQKSSELMNSLNQLSAEDLERMPGLAKGIASRLGIKEDDLAELVKSKDATKQSRTAGLEKLQVEYSEKTKDMTAEQKTAFNQSDEGAELYSKLITGRGREKGGFLQKSASAMKASAMMGASMQNMEGRDLTDSMSLVEADLKTAPDTAAIAEEKSTATGDVARLKALRDNIEDLKNAAKSHTESAEIYNEQFEAFTSAIKNFNEGNPLGTMKTQLDSVIEMLAEKGYAASEPSQ